MGDRVVYEYKLTPVSPVHVGDGGELSGADYYKQGKNIYVIDPEVIFADPALNEEAFIEQVRKYGNDFNWSQFNSELPRKHSRYVLNYKDNGSPNNIFIAAKSAGKTYIPGTTLKGYLRTLILKVISRIEDEDFKRAVTIGFNKAGFNKADSEKEVGQILGKRVFGSDPTLDLMKGIEVGDAFPEKETNLAVYGVKTIKQKRYEMEIKHWTNYAEFIPEGKKLKGKIVIDWDRIETISRKEKRRTFLPPAQRVNLFRKIFDNLEEFLVSLGNTSTGREIEYFNKIYDKRFEDVLKFYRELNGKNIPILRLGRFTGYLSKTAGAEVKKQDKNLFDTITNKYYKNRSPRDFPVTRLLLQEKRGDGSRLTFPPGWMEFNIERKKSYSVG